MVEAVVTGMIRTVLAQREAIVSPDATVTVPGTSAAGRTALVPLIPGL